MRGQSNIVGYVMLAVAVTGIVFGVYFWGKPIMEKSHVRDTIARTENYLSELAKAIESSGEKEITQSYNMYYNGFLKIMSGEIKYDIKVPLAIYATGLRFIPINYKYYFKCTENTEVPFGKEVALCGNEMLIVKANMSQIVINDTFTGRVLTLRTQDYTDLVIQGYVFDVKVGNNKVSFLWKGSVGSRELGDPACIVDAIVTKEGEGQRITYIVKCRPIYDPSTRKCTWIKIKAAGESSRQGSGSVVFNIEYEGHELLDYRQKSTICDYLEIKYVKVSLT